MTLAIRDWTAYNKSCSRFIRGISYGADLLVRCSKKDWGLNKVIFIRAKLQDETSAGRVESNVQTIGYGVGWVWGDTRGACSTRQSWTDGELATMNKCHEQSNLLERGSLIDFRSENRRAC